MKLHPALSYKEPSTLKYGRLFVLTAGGIGLFLILYAGLWFGLSMTLRAEIEDWFQARTAEGYLAEHNDKRARISGFPFRIEARLEEVVLGASERSGRDPAWVWSHDEVIFSILPVPFLFDMLNIDLSGPQVLTWRGESYRGQARDFRFAYDWTSEAIPEKAFLEIAALDLTHVDEDLNVQIRELRFLSSVTANETYEVDLKIYDLVWPQSRIALGDRLGELVFRGYFDRDFAKRVTDTQSLATWRDKGGVFETERIKIDYGPVILQGNGTLALDGDLQLVGAFSARIQGFFRALIMLERAGVIEGPNASMAKVVLGVMAKQPEHGGPSQISLPLSLQNQGLYAGPVRLIDLPEIKW